VSVSAIEEARKFLWRHPWFTSELDDPVELLRDVVKEIDEENAALDEDEDSNTEQAGEIAQRLLAFIKGLRDDLKISETEYQTALALAGVQ